MQCAPTILSGMGSNLWAWPNVWGSAPGEVEETLCGRVKYSDKMVEMAFVRVSYKENAKIIFNELKTQNEIGRY